MVRTRFLTILILLILETVVVESVFSFSASSGIENFAGSINPTTGEAVLIAVSDCGVTTCTNVVASDWIVTSTAGLQYSYLAPTTTIRFSNPYHGYQVVAIEAEADGYRFRQEREIGWLDSQIVPENLEESILINQEVQLHFSVSSQVQGNAQTVQLHLQLSFPYAGAGTPELILEQSTYQDCVMAQQLGHAQLDCQVMVPSNTVLSGWVQVPSDHGQSMVYPTCWLVEHNYYQPGWEAEYPMDQQNTPCAYYGGDVAFLPILTR